MGRIPVYVAFMNLVIVDEELHVVLHICTIDPTNYLGLVVLRV